LSAETIKQRWNELYPTGREVMMKIYLDKQSLKGAQYCAAQTTTSAILDSVLIDVWVGCESSHVRVFASDGTIIGVCMQYLDDIPAISRQNLRIAIPLEVVVQVLSLSADNMIEFRFEDGPFLFFLGGIEFKPMSGYYPKLEDHIPSSKLTVKNDLPRFDSRLFVRAENALKAFYGVAAEKIGFGTLTAFVEEDTCVFHDGSGYAVVVIPPIALCNKEYYSGLFKG
jgi:hypothetical protein